MSWTDYAPGTRVMACAVWLCQIALFACPAPARASVSPDALAADQLSVRDLMRLDTEHALALARSRLAASKVVAPHGTGSDPARRISRDMTGEPRLTAIYGIGRQLMAEVTLDQGVYLYRSGQALPVGVSPGDHIYLLQSIRSSCIELAKKDETRKLCLQPSRWAAQ